jgi:hypothetical protein
VPRCDDNVQINTGGFPGNHLITILDGNLQRKLCPSGGIGNHRGIIFLSFKTVKQASRPKAAKPGRGAGARGRRQKAHNGLFEKKLTAENDHLP